MSSKWIQSRGRFRFYPKPPNKQMLIFVIKAHFSDLLGARQPYPMPVEAGGEAGEGLEEMGFTFDPFVASVKLLSREVISECLPRSHLGESL